MVTNGCENFYLSAQSLVLVPLHFLKDQNVENPQVEFELMFIKHIYKTVTQDFIH